MNSDTTITGSLLAADKAFARQQETASPPYNRDRTWAEWCAEFLLARTDFQTVTKREWQETELAQALFDLQAAYQHSSQRKPWTHYFAQRLNE